MKSTTPPSTFSLLSHRRTMVHRRRKRRLPPPARNPPPYHLETPPLEPPEKLRLTKAPHVDKLLIVPKPTADLSRNVLRKFSMFALYNGGQLRGCPPSDGGAEQSSPWIHLFRGGVCDKFDDIITHKGKIYALDRDSRLYLINNHRKISLGKTLIYATVNGPGRTGCRKRLVSDEKDIYLVVRRGVRWLQVYKVIKRGKRAEWGGATMFGGEQVLVLTRDYCFFRPAANSGFLGREFKNCVVYSEEAFPQNGKDCWEVTRISRDRDYGFLGYKRKSMDICFVRKDEDDICVYRLGGKGDALPGIDWSPPSWLFRASSAAESQAHSLSESCSQAESEPEEDEGLDMNSIDENGGDMDDSQDSNSKDEDGDMDILEDSSSKHETDGDIDNLKDSRSIDEKDGDIDDLKDSSSVDEKGGDEGMHSDLNGQENEHEGTESGSDSQNQEDGYVHELKDSSSKDEMDGDENIHSNFNGQDKEQGEMESGSDNQDQEDGYMECDLNSQEKEDDHSDPNIEDGASSQEDVSCSSFGPESGISKECEELFKSRHHEIFHCVVYLLRPPPFLPSSAPPWIVAAINDGSDQLRLCHPLFLKHQLWNLPKKFTLSKLRPAPIAVAHPTVSFDKLLFVPKPKSFISSKALRKSTMFALYGGHLRGCHPDIDGEQPSPWIKLSRNDFDYKFDDIITHKGTIYALNSEGWLFLINNNKKSRQFRLSKALADTIFKTTGPVGWRKRLVADEQELYMVVRNAVNRLSVYRLTKVYRWFEWSRVERFNGAQVLFMARDYWFFQEVASSFLGSEFKNCIVFSEGSFPQIQKDCCTFTQSTQQLSFVRRSDDATAVFRLEDKTFAWEGENAAFPKINWSPPSWIFQALPISASASKFQAHSLSEYCCQSESEPDEDEGLDVNSNDENDGDMHDLKDSSSKDEDGNMGELKDSSSKHEKDGDMEDLKDSSSIDEEDGDEGMHSNFNDRDKVHEGTECGSDSQDQEDGDLHSLKHSNSKDKDRDKKIQSNFNCQDKEQRGMETDIYNQDQEDLCMECDSNCEEREDEHSNPTLEDGASLQEDVSPSFFEPESETTDVVAMSLSAAEEDVTRTLLSMNGENVAIEDETSRKTITQSVPCACTSSKAKSQISDSATAKFEGFDIRSDLVPTLQKIWQKHGNITENSIMRNVDIVARALESLAIMVRILEDNSAKSLSDSDANYLSSTLADLSCICFKVCWLVPFVEKAVQRHKSKPLVDSLLNLRQLSSQVRERREVLFGELSKLHQEESKLKQELAKVSKMIPFSVEADFDEPLGSGLT